MLAAFLLVHDALLIALLIFLFRPRLDEAAPKTAPDEPPPVSAPPTKVPARSKSTTHTHQNIPALIESIEGLAGLYEPLGFSHSAAASARALMAKLQSLVVAEIIDFEALQKALSQIERNEAGFKRLNDALLNKILAAKDDKAQVLALLNLDPCGEALPFVEQIPVVKDGDIVWRTPVEHAIIRKRPSDEGMFLSTLDALSNAALAIPQRSDEVIEQLADHIERVRADIHRQNAYIPTNLAALGEALGHFIEAVPKGDALAKRQKLDLIIDRLLDAQRRLSDQTRCEPPTVMELAELAAIYLAAPWCHHRWLTRTLLDTLLNATEKLASNAIALARLGHVRDEIGSGWYDPTETRRRLERLEDHTVFVHSLVFALLRLEEVYSGKTPTMSS